MKIFYCDNCGENKTYYKVKLNGISRTKGDILLPAEAQRKHFCSEKCFWNWIKGNLPK